jgi:hypothetical protein
VFGFRNRWYAEAIEHAEHVRLSSSTVVRVATAVYLLASKIDAFNDRGAGAGDLRRRTDFDFGLSAHLQPDEASQNRVDLLRSRVAAIVDG